MELRDIIEDTFNIYKEETLNILRLVVMIVFSIILLVITLITMPIWWLPITQDMIMSLGEWFTKVLS